MKKNRIINVLLFFICITPIYGYAWYDTNASNIAPNWHMRVPINISASSPVNSTIKFEVDFNALIAQLGVTGTFDINSPRIVRPNETLASTQEFTDRIYNGVLDGVANARGEIKFILQDAGPSTYYLYFDVVENGNKPVNPRPTINGNFEHSNGSTPIYWSTSSSNANGAQNNEVHATNFGSSYSSNTVCGDQPISNADTSPNNSGNANTTTGRNWHLLGYRNNCEDGVNLSEQIVISKIINVPANNPGTLTFNFQLQAFDSYDGNNNYDFFQLAINNNPVNHTQLSIPNTGNRLRISSTGIGRRNQYSPQLVDAGWQPATLNLNSFAGQTITVSFRTNFFAGDNSYRSWVKLDDLVWSVFNASLGTPEQSPPSITLKKTSMVISDPINSTNPKRIPGAIIEYTITDTNSGGGAADTIVINDVIPAGTTYVINSLQFIDGTPASGLNATSSNFSYSSDGINFGNNQSVSTTHLRVSPQGQFLAANNAGNPSFQVKFKVKVQ